MALGVPVISTDCPGGPREILSTGRPGCWSPPGNERALAQALRRIVTEPALRNSLSSAGREQAATLSPSTVGRLWLDVLVRAGVVLDSSEGGQTCRR